MGVSLAPSSNGGGGKVEMSPAPSVKEEASSGGTSPEFNASGARTPGAGSPGIGSDGVSLCENRGRIGVIVLCSSLIVLSGDCGAGSLGKKKSGNTLFEMKVEVSPKITASIPDANADILKEVGVFLEESSLSFI